jgi:hypothetical protein
MEPATTDRRTRVLPAECLWCGRPCQPGRRGRKAFCDHGCAAAYYGLDETDLVNDPAPADGADADAA